jgi:hypothetical protein
VVEEKERQRESSVIESRSGFSKEGEEGKERRRLSETYKEWRRCRTSEALELASSKQFHGFFLSLEPTSPSLSRQYR